MSLGFATDGSVCDNSEKETQLFWSWTIHPQAFATDAMSISWQNLFANAFPPIQRCCKIWPRQYWFPTMLRMLIDYPMKLPPWKNLLSQGKGQVLHPDPLSLNLMAWLLSTDSLLQKGFQKDLENCCHLHGEVAQKRTITKSLDSSTVGVLNGIWIPFRRHPYIIRLLKGVFNERPPIKCLSPNWDFSFVLGCLKEAPFEPLKDASFQHLTWKTCF